MTLDWAKAAGAASAQAHAAAHVGTRMGDSSGRADPVQESGETRSPHEHERSVQRLRARRKGKIPES